MLGSRFSLFVLSLYCVLFIFYILHFTDGGPLIYPKALMIFLVKMFHVAASTPLSLNYDFEEKEHSLMLLYDIQVTVLICSRDTSQLNFSIVTVS